MPFLFCQSIFLLLLSFLGENQNHLCGLDPLNCVWRYQRVNVWCGLPQLSSPKPLKLSRFSSISFSIAFIYFFPQKKPCPYFLLRLTSLPLFSTLLWNFSLWISSLNCILFFYWVLPHACTHTLGCPILPKETPWPLDLLSLFLIIFLEGISHTLLFHFFPDLLLLFFFLPLLHWTVCFPNVLHMYNSLPLFLSGTCTSFFLFLLSSYPSFKSQ